MVNEKGNDFSWSGRKRENWWKILDTKRIQVNVHTWIPKAIRNFFFFSVSIPKAQFFGFCFFELAGHFFLNGFLSKRNRVSIGRFFRSRGWGGGLDYIPSFEDRKPCAQNGPPDARGERSSNTFIWTSWRGTQAVFARPSRPSALLPIEVEQQLKWPLSRSNGAAPGPLIKCSKFVVRYRDRTAGRRYTAGRNSSVKWIETKWRVYGLIPSSRRSRRSDLYIHSRKYYIKQNDNDHRSNRVIVRIALFHRVRCKIPTNRHRCLLSIKRRFSERSSHLKTRVRSFCKRDFIRTNVPRV